ncbi:hypothetical protein [Microbulbifer sp. 2205BS26-8]|uniref:DUF6984 family protein n=1 Tax=Microbulbifer sp. 2205BS26-8 TaxID=3064386 RepID=UPI00273E78BD|nr:hypothetical protein [Microbulbifer sp. 2205BS26-8]MDP5211355.1 hypothetical protein [Microbulbifer sp. 2205BS26-8]
MPRKPTVDELRLITNLVSKANDLQLPINWSEKILVKTMSDGGMGSLRLDISGLFSKDRIFGKQVSECKFIDIDAVEVIASLYVDQNGDLFELDIWKTNFEKLKQIPKNFKDV